MSPANSPRPIRRRSSSRSRLRARASPREFASSSRTCTRGAFRPRTSPCSRSARISRSAEGAVVFENELIQLIPVHAGHADCFKRPARDVLRLASTSITSWTFSRQNSLVRYAVEQVTGVHGASVRNITEELGISPGTITLKKAVLKALEVASAICAAEKVNAARFLRRWHDAWCRRSRSWPQRVKIGRERDVPRLDARFLRHRRPSAFSSTRRALRWRGRDRQGRIRPGRDLALVFSGSRRTTLVWSYVVNNYLKGNRPSVDLLYWNADPPIFPDRCTAVCAQHLSRNRPARSRARRWFSECRWISGRSRFRLVLARARTHRALAHGLSTTQLLGARMRFVLGATARCGSSIPPSKKQRSHWIGAKLLDPAEWLADGKEKPGSWWPDWSAWLAGFGVSEQGAQAAGQYEVQTIEPAPGAMSSTGSYEQRERTRFFRERSDYDDGCSSKTHRHKPGTEPGAGSVPPSSSASRS